MSVEFGGASAPRAAVRGKLLSAAVRGKLSFRFVLLASSALSAIILPPPPAIAAIVGSDTEIKSSGDDAVGRGGVAPWNGNPVIASQNSIAMVGDADCHALSGVGLGDRVFDPTTIWGKGDADRTDGIYGFGEQSLITGRPILGADGKVLTGGTFNDGTTPLPTVIDGNTMPLDQPNGLRYYQGGNAGKGQKQGSKAWYKTATGWRTGNVQQGPGGWETDGGTLQRPNPKTAWTQALGVNSVAIGCDARANGYGSYAYGWGAWASGAGSYAQGINARATGQGTLALGIYARATGDDAIAQGSLAQASGSGATAIGAMTQATGANSVAIGSGDGSKAVASMNGTPGAAQTDGFGARAMGANTVALGYQAQAKADGGAALASDALADRAAGIAGYDLKTKQASTVDSPIWKATRGAASVGDSSKGITRQIAGVAAGSDDTDAVNLAQLKQAAADSQSSSVLYDANADGSRQNRVSLIGGNTAQPVTITNLARGDITANSTDAVNGGQLFETNSNVSANTTNISKNTNDITNISNGSIGPVQRATGDNLNLTARSGSTTTPQKLRNLAAGVSATDAVNMSQLTDTNATVDRNRRNFEAWTGDADDRINANISGIATNTKTITDNKTASDTSFDRVSSYLGGGANIAAGTAPAYKVQTNTANNVGDAFGLVDSSLTSFDGRITKNSTDIGTITTDITNINNGSVGPVRRTTDGNLTLTAQNGDAATPGTPQKLRNLAAGTANDEAVNYGQLTATNNNVTANAQNIDANKTASDTSFDRVSSYLGGGANIAAGTAPIYKVQTNTANNVGDAFGLVDSSLTAFDGRITKNSTDIDGINTSITNINNGKAGSVRRLDDNTDILTLIDRGGKDGTLAQKLTNLADGGVAADSKDAINGSQLFATNNNVDANRQNIGANSQTITANKDAADKSFTDIDARRTADNSQIAAYFGGNAAFQNGAWTAPSYTVQGNTADNVGGAFANVDSSLTEANQKINKNTSDITTINTDITNINNGAVGPVRRTTDGNLTLTAQNGDAATPGTAQKLKNLADGTDDTDAVNYGQLKTTNNNVADNTKNIGANSQLIADNKGLADTNFGNVSTWLGGGANIAAGTAPAYKVQTNTANNVGDAFGLVDSSLTAFDGRITKNSTDIDGINTSITNINTGKAGSVRRLDDNADILTLIDRGGKGGAIAQKLTNLADGGVAADSKDAVNGSQLFATNTAIDNNKKDADGKFTNIDNSITNINNGSVGPVRRTADGNLTLTAQNGDAATPGTAQKLKNLAAGTDDTDAVNYGQLTATNNNIADNTKNIGANSQLIADNKGLADTNFGNVSTWLGGGANIAAGTAPSYTVQGKTADNVGDAFTNVDTGLTSINSAITNINTGKAGSVRRLDDNADILTLIDRSGNGNTAQKLTNLADGDLSASSKDAVNGNQLFATNTVVDNNKKDADGKFTNIDNSITNINNGSVGPVRRTTDGNLTLTAQNGDAATPGTAQKLRNLAAGTANDEAVNYGQLTATNNNVTANAQNIDANKTASDDSFSRVSSYLGGGANIAAGTAPSYAIRSIDDQGNITSATHNNVGDALNSLDSNTSNVNSRVTNVDNRLTTITDNINNGKAGSVRRLDDNADILTLIDRSGNGSTAQKLTNLDKGDLAEDSKDAVNGSQLFATNTAIADNKKDADDKFTNIDNSITNINNGSVGPVRRTTDGNLTLTAQNGDAATPGTAQKLKNLADGTDDTDAVNYGQLKKTDSAVAQNRTDFDTASANVNKFLGGGADIRAGTAPSYTVQGKTADNVGDAFTNVDTGLTSINSAITNINTGKAGSVRRLDDNADTLTLIDRSGNGSTAQKLTNLDKGDLTEDSKDAVNGSQLFATNKTIADNRLADNSQIASYFGGGAGFQGGLWTQPSYTIRSIDAQGQASQITHNNVGDALGGLDNSVNNVNSHVNNVDQRVTNITDNINKGGLGPVRRTAGGDLTLTAQGGDAANPGTPQKLTNLADGTLSATSKDAVNGGQLFETNERVGKVEDRVTNVEGKVTDLGGRVDKIGSVAENAVVYDTDKATGKRQNSISLIGADSSQPVAINNVADGKIDKSSKQAVNGGQLHGVKEELVASIDQSSKDTLKGANLYTDNSSKATLRQANDYTDSRISNFADDAVDRANQYTDRRFGSLNRKIHNVRKEARSAAAIGLAAASLRFNDAPGKLSVGVGGGAWKSQGAFSFGAGYTDYSGKIRANVTGTLADGTVGVGGGVTFTLN